MMAKLLIIASISLLVFSASHAGDNHGTLTPLQSVQAQFKSHASVGASIDGKPIYKINSQTDYAKARLTLIEYGVSKFFAQMVEFGIFSNDGIVLPAAKPFNPFARLASNTDVAPYGDILLNLGLTESARHFMVTKNLPANDVNWNNLEKASQGNASMSLRHRFIIPRDPKWSNFNVLTIGINESKSELAETITYLKSMKQTALEYTKKERELKSDDTAQQWSENIGLFFHCFPFNSVQYLHLHVVDLDFTGPAFGHMYNKNLSIDYVIAQLEAELATQN